MSAPPDPPVVPAILFDCPYAECAWPDCREQPKAGNYTLCASAEWCERMKVKIVPRGKAGAAPVVGLAPPLMNEQHAREILGGTIQFDGGLFCLGFYVSWSPSSTTATLDDSFTADQLEAIAWWIRNKQTK